MKLEDVTWAYGGRVEGYDPTEVPGLLVSRRAFGKRRVPADLIEKGRKVLDALAEEYDASEAPEGEALMVDGHALLRNGDWWWSFRTLSSFSFSGWFGIKDGEITVVEIEEEI